MNNGVCDMRNYKTATKIIVEQLAEAQFHRYMSGSDHQISNVAMANALAVVYDMKSSMILNDLDKRVEASLKVIRDDYYGDKA